MTTRRCQDRPVAAIVFDVFGTVVDWRGSLLRWFERFGREHDRAADWGALVDDWRAAYQPSMEPIRSGTRAFVTLDVLHRESLEALLPAHGLAGLSDVDRQGMVAAWHTLDPWPDSVAGLARLKRKYIIATLSNGGVRLLVDIARHAGLPWDTTLSADVFGKYKPDPAVYRGAAEVLRLPASDVLMVAAHSLDLTAARGCGLRTALVRRPAEYGPRRPPVPSIEEGWDFTVDSLVELADRLGA